MFCFLDQNALIKLFDRCAASDKPPCALAGCQVVVSVWHLVETANTAALDRAVALADFIDALDPLWLLERRDLQRIEVAESFYDFVGIKHQSVPRFVARRDALAALNRRPPNIEFDISSRDFVADLILHPEHLATFLKSVDSDIKALRRLRSISRGKLEPQKLNQARVQAARRLVEYSMPSHTPEGIEIGLGPRFDYLAQVDPLKIPTISIEVATSRIAQEGIGKNDRNTLIDKFHLISAFPYVDELVTDDRFFWNIHNRLQSPDYAKARLRKFDDFWSGCLSSGWN